MFVLKNFTDIALQSTELLELPFDHFYEIISDDMLNTKDEEPVWECCLNWIEQDPNDRRAYVRQLLEGIRLGLMNAKVLQTILDKKIKCKQIISIDLQFFVSRVKNHDYVRECEEAGPILAAVLKFMADLDTIELSMIPVITPAFAIPRLPHEIIFTIGGWFEGEPRTLIESYDTRADRWIRVKHDDPSGPRAYHGAAVIGHQIYCIGGFNGIEHFNTCTVFDAIKKQWREIAPMHSKRCYVSVCELNGKIYAMGGHNGVDRLRTVECYCPEKNQWTILQSMSIERSDAHATVLNGRIYILGSPVTPIATHLLSVNSNINFLGGFNGSRCLDSVEWYNVAQNTWHDAVEMTTRRSGLSCIAHNGYIYAIGGFNGATRLCTGEKYDPYTENWSPIREMGTPRSNFGIEIIDDMIFVIGGFDGVTTIDATECYNVDKNRWLEATSMNHFRSAHTASVLAGLPNVMDYVYKNRMSLLEERRMYMAQRMQIAEIAPH